MKTTVVPAQITTVEDRIAGSLTFPQVVLLIIPLMTSSAIYICIPPLMHFGITKIVLICLQFLFFGLLAVRFRGKIVADWLVIYLRFTLRPRRYIFTKNDINGRDIETMILKESSVIKKKTVVERKTIPSILSLPDKAKVDQLLQNPALTVSFKFGKKGGLDVSLKPIKD